MDNFWTALPQPFFALAPMEDVTDAAFRALIAQYGDPSIPRVFYTEFTSADGLVLAPEKAQTALRARLLFTPAERPIVAQLFSAVPERMEAAARIVAGLGFDGLDINMGCPDKAVEKGGAGAALIRNSQLARELTAAARRGANGLPISVKTRIGYSKENELEEWLGEILAEKPAALAVHLRTRKEMSAVPAHWECMSRILGVRDSVSPTTRIIGNGDVRDLADAREKAAASGCDGVMLGRAVFGNPWLFSEHAASPAERIAALAEHIRLFDELLGSTAHYATMKKHFKAYISGWHGAAELRAQLMETEDLGGAVAVLRTALECPGDCG